MANLQEQLSDQLLLAEDVSLATSIYGRAVVSSFSLTLAGAIHGYEELSDSIVLTDQAGRVFAELLSDTATFSEILLRVKDESVSNDFRITQIVGQYNSGQKLLDAITLTDAVATTAIYLRVITDSLSSADSSIVDYSVALIAKEVGGSFPESAPLDVSTGIFILLFIDPDDKSPTAEALVLSDSVVPAVNVARPFSSRLAINHAMEYTTIYDRSLTDALVLANAAWDVYVV